MKRNNKKSYECLFLLQDGNNNVSCSVGATLSNLHDLEEYLTDILTQVRGSIPYTPTKLAAQRHKAAKRSKPSKPRKRQKRDSIQAGDW